MKHQRREQALRNWFMVPERNHLLLLVALSFLIGCLLAPKLSPGGWPWALAGVSLLLALALKTLGRRAGVAIALLVFALGVLRTHAALYIPQPEPGRCEIAATVSGGARLRSDNRISFRLTHVSLNGEPVSGDAYCTLHYDEAPPELFDGALVHLEGRVYLPDGKSGEPHMDFSLWMRQQNLSFCIAAYQGVTVENTVQTAPVIDPWYRMRQAFSRALESVMGDNARVAMALLLGERSGLTEAENSDFQTLGIAHVMSVSGLHVGILGGIVCWLMDRLRMGRRAQLPVLALFLAAYCALTGFSSAAIRAAVMMLYYALARIFLRFADRLTVLGGSMLAVLALQPLQASSAGFVLSYSAMLGITLYANTVEEGLDCLWPPLDKKRPLLLRRLQRSVQSLLTVSLTAQLGVLLPTAAYFHQLPLYGVAINMVIVPLVSHLLVPLYAAALPCSLVPGLGSAVGFIASRLTDLLLWLVELLSALPYASLRVASPSALVCIGLGLALVRLSRRMPGSLRRRILSAVLIASVTLGLNVLRQPADVRYIQLSVGQADCALLLDGDATMLIDAGSDGDAALDYLLDEGRDIDALFITHLHMDHIGGVEQLLQSQVDIHQVYLPEGAQTQQADERALLLLDKIRAAGIPVAELASGDELRYNKTTLTVLWPQSGKVRAGHDANDMPLVLSIDLDGYTLLSASDLTGAYETYAAAPADVLKVAHHGSSQSTGEDFLRFVSPRIALISASSGSASLPGADTLNRLSDSGAQVLRTDECGDITLSVTNGVLTASPYKER